MNKTHKYILGGGAVLLVLAGTAFASSYVTRESMVPEKPVQKARSKSSPVQQHVVATQPAQPPCDDHNIVGTAGGAVAGALVGNQFGKGSGNKVATIGGLAGGAYLGNQYIPTRGAACR